jgi:hypothetical protein
METYSINKESIDWASFRTEMSAVAGTAQTIPDTCPAIGVALRLFDDHESFIITWGGE